ncbi:MAG: helix-turn-helix domain-containing protein [Alistipes sp.]|nr:helix-turn-helix domain-containing protein [Alistipes sp.]
MKNYLIGQQDPRIKDMLQKMDATEQMLDKMLSRTTPSFMGERYITDEELSKRLKLHRRTLQDYRTQGILPYYLICGKVLYKESEIQLVLDKMHYKAFADM